MRLLIPMILSVFLLPMPVSAMEFTAPAVPYDAADRMPQTTNAFGEGLIDVIQKAFLALRPDIKGTLALCITLIAAAMTLSIFCSTTGKMKHTAQLAGTAIISGILLTNTNSMIHMGSATIMELTEYGKLLYPVMTAALAAQGGVTASAALYAGTMAFISILSSLISQYLVPFVYIFLSLSVAESAVSEPVLTRMRGLIKQGSSWCLKTLLTIFTTYLSITGVVSGTTDAAALKAAKITIASFVPVVGGILSDASESVLISASIAKNAAGIYGIFAILAVFLEPFLRIGLQYVFLKITTAFYELLGPKNLTSLVDDFSTAMGLILAMTGSVCLLLLISTVCFMKGIH